MTTDLQILPFFRKWLIFPGKYILLKHLHVCTLILPHLCVLDFNTIMCIDGCVLDFTTIMCIDGCVLVIKRYIILYVRA
jgi:hypothetical protein